MAPLELVVEEPIAGHFYWMIVRPAHAGHAPTIIDYARGPMRSHQAAWDAAAGVYDAYVEAEEEAMTGPWMDDPARVGTSSRY
ncbi:MAG: hypothetical protein EOP82_13255 [Variovorax sp.]|nr:MAG: hypothetical protein EOP82_13255 [Variovorax sp.]